VPDNATIPGTLCLRADVLHDALRSLPAVAPQRVSAERAARHWAGMPGPKQRS